MVVPASDATPHETETREKPRICGQPELHSEFRVTSGYNVRFCLTIMSGQGGRDEIEGGIEGRKGERNRSSTGSIEKVPDVRR